MKENGQTDKRNLTINIKGFLMDFGVPKVMGILNVTPDSFYSNSRCSSKKEIETRIIQIVEEGADIIDIGACSTRLGSDPVSLEEEWKRLESALDVLKVLNLHTPISVDTFRAEIARRCVEIYDVDIVNDISGCYDAGMGKVIAELKVPYILTHSNSDSKNIHNPTEYQDVTADVITNLAKKVNELHSWGVKDIIIDPGFGFSKNLKENFGLLNHLNEFEIFEAPILVGVSRKSMVYKTLNISPEESLIGSISLEAFALDRGADILRVHDVAQTKELVILYCSLNS